MAAVMADKLNTGPAPNLAERTAKRNDIDSTQKEPITKTFTWMENGKMSGNDSFRAASKARHRLRRNTWPISRFNALQGRPDWNWNRFPKHLMEDEEDLAPFRHVRQRSFTMPNKSKHSVVLKGSKLNKEG